MVGLVMRELVTYVVYETAKDDLGLMCEWRSDNQTSACKGGRHD